MIYNHAFGFRTFSFILGYLMTMDSRRSSNNWGGVLYAYNNSTIRFWTNFAQGLYI
jgi:hypothetical protein